MPHLLASILTCLIDNAKQARDKVRDHVCITVRTKLISVPEAKDKVQSRVQIDIENDGPPISPDLAPYLFVNRVSTHVDGTNHRGSGLSSARLQAQAFGGDVILLSPNPVNFAVILEPVAQEGSS